MVATSELKTHNIGGTTTTTYSSSLLCEEVMVTIHSSSHGTFSRTTESVHLSLTVYAMAFESRTWWDLATGGSNTAAAAAVLICCGEKECAIRSH